MPELPEVETIKRDLEKKVTGKTFREMELLVSHIIKIPDPERLPEQLSGQTITGMGRRGKYLLFFLDSGRILVIHLRMTGQLVYCDPVEPREKHLCLIFNLWDEENKEISQLRYLDIRRFGCFYLVNDINELSGLANLGPEPFGEDFTLSYLIRALQDKKGKIKALLLDQTIIAGIGNIYADETLFRAGIHPERPGNSLSEEEIARLHRLIPEVLQDSIEKRGTTISDYRDAQGKKGGFQNYLQMYGQAGRPCIQCGTTIEKIKIAGRSSCFCPHCQR